MPRNTLGVSGPIQIAKSTGSEQVDWSKFNEDDDNTTHRSEKACAGGACQLV